MNQFISLITDNIQMWTFEEIIDGQKLTEIINTQHENPKYLPGIKLPHNLISNPDLVDCTIDCDIFIFVLPHQFLFPLLPKMKPHIKPTAVAVSLLKGFAETEKGGIDLVSDTLRKELNIPVAVLMGANIAQEVAEEKFCEATLGCKDHDLAVKLKKLFQTNYFRISITNDEATVEICGALKNVVALAAGFVEGLGYGGNTKAAVIRLGCKEMISFIHRFYGDRGPRVETFLESCGIADVITTCYGGRNRKVAMAHAETGKPIKELEQELLGGQSAQGVHTAYELQIFLAQHMATKDFPLFIAVDAICKGELDVMEFIHTLENHPEHR